MVEVDHSLGALTGSVATSEQVNRGVTDAAVGTVTFIDGAANTQRMADQVNTATSGTGVVQQSTHKDDMIGTFVGGNAAISDPNGPDLSFEKSHSSYTGSLPPASGSAGFQRPSAANPPDVNSLFLQMKQRFKSNLILWSNRSLCLTTLNVEKINPNTKRRTVNAA